MPLGSVVVTLPIHPLAGQVVNVEGFKRQSGRQYVLVRHPDGSRVGLPLDWTDRWPRRLVGDVSGRQVLLDPAGLKRAALAVADWRSRASQKFDLVGDDMIPSGGGTDRPESRMDTALDGDSGAGSGCLGASGATGIRSIRRGKGGQRCR